MVTDPAVFALVEMNGGRWIARCPRPGCAGAESFGRCDDGTAGGLTGDSFTCRPQYGGCGLRCAARWPAQVEDIERLTLARPVPTTRNWVPGETLEQLLAENMAHGLMPVFGEPVAISEGRILPPELTPGHVARQLEGRHP